MCKASRTFTTLVVTALLLAGALVAQAPQPSAQPVNLQEVIPFDAAVRSGALPNGLRFYIRRNARPANRVALRLAVKAGSLFEADDQQGLAHFLEHMAFNGSEHFKPGELISYFESTGARLGPHVNAYTGFDETVYMLDLPTDSMDVLTRGLTALADFGGGLTLDPEQVDKERGVVVEEWRGRLGAGSRIRDRQIPVLFYQSLYADRLPIGKPEILKSAPPARLRAFYDTWYRPDRMAVIVVGDIDVDRMDAAIRAAFGSLRARAPAAPPPDGRVPLHRESLFSITSDPEVTQSSVQIGRKRAREGQTLVGDYRRSLVERLFERMFNERLGELARKPDAKFLAAGAGDGGISPSVSMFSLNARVQDGMIGEGLSAIETEARRVREFGFTPPELDRARKSMIALYERAWNERDKSESASFAQEYVNHFLEEEPSPGIDYEYRLVQQLLPGITLDDVATLARSRLQGEGLVVLAVTPQKEGAKIPAQADLQASLDAAARAAVTPWTEAAIAAALMARVPEPARVESRRDLSDLGITIVRFANGIEAWLKPTDFKNDQVLFTMYAPGGASLASEADYLQAEFATTYVELSGVGGFKATELQRMRAGKLASASPSISASTHSIGGSASPGDLETALQLLYLNFTAPGDDGEAFALIKRQLEAVLANRGRSPGQVFGEKVAEVNTSNHYTSRPLTLERLATLDRAKMLTFYRERFANAADFTFFMVGTFQVEAVVPLLARYLGALPSQGSRTSRYRDVGMQFPSAVQRVRVEKGREPRSQALMSFFADPPYEPLEVEKLSAATTVLETVLRDSLREDLGQTYTVSVGFSQSVPERGYGYTAVNFGAAPENIEAMTERVLQTVRRLQREGPAPEQVANAKETARRDYETALKQNGYWMARLQRIHLLGGDPHDIITRTARIEQVTPEAVQEMFTKYFPLDRYTIVTLMPES
jgi:zinc protease